MTDPTPLSPAAQAVLDACLDENFGDDFMPSELRVIAAALRAAAHEAKRVIYQQTLVTDGDKRWKEGAVAVVDGLLNIAAELEGAQ